MGSPLQWEISTKGQEENEWGSQHSWGKIEQDDWKKMHSNLAQHHALILHVFWRPPLLISLIGSVQPEMLALIHAATLTAAALQ